MWLNISNFRCSCQGEFKVTERHLTMAQLCSALQQQRVKEMFGSGTACMICRIGQVVYQGEVSHLFPKSIYSSCNTLTKKLCENK